MGKDEEERIKQYMLQTKQKVALIRHKGQYYHAEIYIEITAWENYELECLRLTLLPPPVELVQ